MLREDLRKDDDANAGAAVGCCALAMADCRKTFATPEPACVFFLSSVLVRRKRFLLSLAAAGSAGEGPAATAAAEDTLGELADPGAIAAGAASAGAARFRLITADTPGEDRTTTTSAASTLDEDDAAIAVRVAGAGAEEAISPGTASCPSEIGFAATIVAAGTLDEELAANAAASATGAGAAEAPFTSSVDEEAEAGNEGGPSFQALMRLCASAVLDPLLHSPT